LRRVTATVTLPQDAGSPSTPPEVGTGPLIVPGLCRILDAKFSESAFPDVGKEGKIRKWVCIYSTR